MGLAALAVATLIGPAAFADTITVRSGPTAEIVYKDVTVTKIKDGEIYFIVAGGTRETNKRLADVRNLDVANEAGFSAAEKAFKEAETAKDPAEAKKKYADAVAGYQVAVKSPKAWLRDFATARLNIAAPKSGRFDLAIAGWIAMVPGDPSGALKGKPDLGGVDPKSKYLEEAIKSLTIAKNGTAKAEEKRAYLELIGDIQTYIGDLRAAAKTQEERVSIGGSPQEIAELAVKLAFLDFSEKSYDAALARLAKIDLNLLTEPTRADAAFMLAEIKSAKMAGAGTPDAWKDLALEYMRIVANHPSSQNAGTALLKVAEIHETGLKEPETALKIYQQVAREHANTPAGVAAQKNVDRLAKAAAAGG